MPGVRDIARDRLQDLQPLPGRKGWTHFCDHARRPVRYANQLPEQVERLIVALKRDKPHWGARKIRELLVQVELPR